MGLSKAQQQKRAELDLRAMAHVASFVDREKDGSSQDALEARLHTVIDSNKLLHITQGWDPDNPWPHDEKTLLGAIGRVLSDKTRRAASYRNLDKNEAWNSFFRHGSNFFSAAFRTELATQRRNDATAGQNARSQISEGENEAPPPAYDSRTRPQTTHQRPSRKTRPQDGKNGIAPSGSAQPKTKLRQQTVRGTGDVQSVLGARAFEEHEQGQYYQPPAKPRSKTTDVQSKYFAGFKPSQAGQQAARDDEAAAAGGEELVPSGLTDPPAFGKIRRPKMGVSSLRTAGNGTQSTRKRRAEMIEEDESEIASTNKKLKTRPTAAPESVGALSNPLHQSRKVRPGSSSAVNDMTDHGASGQRVHRKNDRPSMSERTSVKRNEDIGVHDFENTRESALDQENEADAALQISSGAVQEGEHVDVPDENILGLDLAQAIDKVGSCLQDALDLLFLDGGADRVAHFADEPVQTLKSLYITVFGKHFCAVTDSAISAEDQYKGMSGVRFSANNLLRCLIWHFLVSEIMEKEQLEDAVYVLMGKAQTYLQDALSGESVTYHSLLRRGSEAQLTNSDFDDTLDFHTEETASKLMAVLRQHLNVAEIPKTPQNWRLQFSKALRKVCKLAFLFKTRMAMEETRTELRVITYPKSIKNYEGSLKPTAENAQTVLLMQRPGIVKLHADGSEEIVSKWRVKYCRPEMEKQCIFVATAVKRKISEDRSPPLILSNASEMPRKSKNKTGPSNRRAMRTILRLVDANLGTLTTKEGRLNWLKPLANSGKFPYTGTQEIGDYHHEDTLHEAITYAVRDAKKDEYKILAGRRALDRFFELGSAMLTGEYLVAIGYMFRNDSGALQLQDEAGALKDDPVPTVKQASTQASTISAKQLATGSKANDRENVSMGALPDAQSTHKDDDSSPTGTQDRASKVLFEPPKHRPIHSQPDQHDDTHTAESPDIVYEPVPTSAGKKRKFVQFLDSDPESAPENVMVLNSDTLDALRLWEDIESLTKTIAELSQNLCTTAQALKLKSPPSTSLEGIYAHIFNTTDWRLAYDHLVKYGEIKSCSLLQAVFWAFLDLRVLGHQHFPFGSDSESSVPMNSEAALLVSPTEFMDKYPRKEAIEQFHKSKTVAAVLQPHAKILAHELHAIVAEHLVIDNTSSSSDAEVHSLLSSSIDTIQGICVKASLLKVLIDISKGKYRLLKHLPGSDIYHRRELNSSQNTSSEISRETIVAFTIAPGLERKLADADTYTSVGPATIAELRK
ncbi:hypothetical protein CBER1_06394 [Cercospora berteroae]|uniref:Uncharacterized protein n=1 Tax=Cercospora berteroae TaxID=357750 RepID=A0A2S6C994_9PEZI|nr:hypothetical protein CBER1_06394 [Cercospora berteroae]